jgi:peptidoglycan-associated lipoprotein
MKKLNLFSVLFTSVALMATGCHRHPSLTPIPGIDRPPGDTTGGVPPGTGIGGDTGASGTTSSPGGLSASDRNFDGTQDREKFAADTVYFDFDRATIKASEESKLADVANYFKSNPSQLLIIEGNCDERGTEKYNLSLGDRRALAAREYLANLGMDASKIKTVTYGASKPVDPGHDEAAWKKNRRDDMILVTPK